MIGKQCIFPRVVGLHYLRALYPPPTFYLSLFPILIGVALRINKLLMGFLLGCCEKLVQAKLKKREINTKILCGLVVWLHPHEQAAINLLFKKLGLQPCLYIA